MSQNFPAPREEFPQTNLHSVVIASYLLMAGGLLLVMWQNLLPGLLCVCAGFMLTRALARLLARLQRRTVPGHLPHWAQVVAAAIIMLAPLALLTSALPHTRGYIVEAPQQYKELLDYLARTVLELRHKLPADIASQLPDGAREIQKIIAGYLGAKAGALATAGKAWLSGLLHAYVGLLVGALAAVRSIPLHRAPLVDALHQRISDRKSVV